MEKTLDLKKSVAELVEEYPEVRVDYCHIDAATIYMVTDPGRFDVIVTDNLFGDILTDEAGAGFVGARMRVVHG